MQRFECAPQLLDWLSQLNRRELLGRYPAWNYSDTLTPSDRPDREQDSERHET